MAFGVKFRSVGHLRGGFHPRPGEAVLTLLSRLLLLLRRLLAPSGRFVPRLLVPGPPPDSRASRLSTRWRSSEMTLCCSAMIASRVSRLARSSPVPIVLLCHNCAPVASAFQPGAGLRQIRLTKSEQLPMARHLAAGTRMDGFGYGAGLGTGSAHLGRWATAFGEGGPAALIFEQSGGSPRRPRRGAAGTTVKLFHLYLEDSLVPPIDFLHMRFSPWY